MVMLSTLSYAVNGKQYVVAFTGTGMSMTSGVLKLTEGAMPRAARNGGVYVFALL
jgi:hypothetical protein